MPGACLAQHKDLGLDGHPQAIPMLYDLRLSCLEFGQELPYRQATMFALVIPGLERHLDVELDHALRTLGV